MKILLLSPHFAQYSLLLARALVQQHGVSVLLVMNESNYQSEVGGLAGDHCSMRLKIILLPHKRSLGCLLSNTWRYWRLIREFKPDVIHAQEEPKDYLAFSLLLTSLPVVLTIHDPRAHGGDSSTAAPFSRHAIYRRYLRYRARAAIVHGASMLDQLREQGFGKTAVVAPHGPLGILHRQSTQDWVTGRCLFFGRMQSYKGLAEFIHAIELTATEHPEVHGVIAGRGPELLQFQEKLRNNTRFSVMDRFLSPQDVMAQFQKANVVVLPYREATQSGVAAYALGVGRPMVVTRVGSLPEVVDNGQNGFIVPPKQALALAQAISLILANRTLARMMGEHSLTIGRGRLSWETAAIATVALYDHLEAQK